MDSSDLFKTDLIDDVKSTNDDIKSINDDIKSINDDIFIIEEVDINHADKLSQSDQLDLLILQHEEAEINREFQEFNYSLALENQTVRTELTRRLLQQLLESEEHNLPEELHQLVVSYKASIFHDAGLELESTADNLKESIQSKFMKDIERLQIENQKLSNRIQQLESEKFSIDSYIDELDSQLVGLRLDKIKSRVIQKMVKELTPKLTTEISSKLVKYLYPIIKDREEIKAIKNSRSH